MINRSFASGFSCERGRSLSRRRLVSSPQKVANVLNRHRKEYPLSLIH